MDNNKIIIIGSGLESKTALLLSKMDENVEIINVAEARKRGIDISEELETKLNAITEIPEIKTFKFENRPQLLNYEIPFDMTPPQSKFKNKHEKRNIQKHFNKIHNQKFRK